MKGTYKDQKKIEGKEQKNQLINDSIKDSNNNINKIVETILNEINYINLIFQSFIYYSKDLKQDILKNISKILNNELKNNQFLQEKYNSIFNSIKNNIPEIQTLNFIVVGFPWAGKSTLTNAILKDDLTKEGQNNNFNTQLFKQYSNPNKVPGINIYDIIGFDPIEIKKIIHDIFD